MSLCRLMQDGDTESEPYDDEEFENYEEKLDASPGKSKDPITIVDVSAWQNGITFYVIYFIQLFSTLGCCALNPNRFCYSPIGTLGSAVPFLFGQQHIYLLGHGHISLIQNNILHPQTNCVINIHLAEVYDCSMTSHLSSWLTRDSQF